MQDKSSTTTDLQHTRRHWSGIVFAKRKLTVLALHKLICACPSLSFLRAAPLMGYGGRVAAASQGWKASSLLNTPYKGLGQTGCLGIC